MRYLILSLIILLGLSSPATSGTRDPKTPDSKHIEYGKKHQCVVPVRGTQKLDGNKKALFFGSGVIVRPRILITASHVLQGSDQSYILIGDKQIKILGYACPKGDQTKEVGPMDIAIAWLEEPVELDFYPELYSENDEIGKICSVAGWGLNGTWITGTVNEDNKRRAGSNHVDKTLLKGMLVTSVNSGVGTSLEYLIGQGDSGGGLFIDKKLAGIHSCIFTSDGKLDSSYKDWAAHTRVSMHKAWMEEIIKILEDQD